MTDPTPSEAGGNARPEPQGELRSTPRPPWRTLAIRELRERPMAYGVLAGFLVLGPIATHHLFPQASPGVALIGGLVFGFCATLCAIPEKFI